MSYVVELSAAPPDPLVARLRWAVLGSVLLNLGLWRAVASVTDRSRLLPPAPVEITRVVLDPRGRSVEQVMTPKQVEKKVAAVRRVAARATPPPVAQHPRPVAARSEPRRPAARPVHQHAPHPDHAPEPARPTPPREPEGAHNRILTAPEPATPAPPRPGDFTALPGGNAELGKPIEEQAPGAAVTNPAVPALRRPAARPAPAPIPAVPEPAPEPKPEAPRPERKPEPREEVPVAPRAEPRPEPRPEPRSERPRLEDRPVAPSLAPPVLPRPKPRGVTRDAEPANTVQPQIPESLRQSEFKSFVRVRVEIEPDGTAMPVLRTSSGNPEVDRRVLEALRRWTWKPALRDGEAVKSTQLFKFEFEVK